MKTKIEWTERTWNPIIGCTKISAGCKNCYAEKQSIRINNMVADRHMETWADFSSILRFDYSENENGIAKGFNGDVNIRWHKLREPFSWRKPSMIFVNSMSDLFHENIPFKYIADIFDVMCADLIPKRGKSWYECEDESDYREVAKHTYQVLTKRPNRMLEFFEWVKDNIDSDRSIRIQMEQSGGRLPENIWLGVSVENQRAADERIPLLLQTPAKVKFLSIEPMLEPIELQNIVFEHNYLINALTGKADTHMGEIGWNKVDWVIVGCESGMNRRPCKIEWVESIVEQCRSAKIPVFVKQLNINGKVIKDINQFPKHLQIREFPK